MTCECAAVSSFLWCKLAPHYNRCINPFSFLCHFLSSMMWGHCELLKPSWDTKIRKQIASIGTTYNKWSRLKRHAHLFCPDGKSKTSWGLGTLLSTPLRYFYFIILGICQLLSSVPDKCELEIWYLPQCNKVKKRNLKCLTGTTNVLETFYCCFLDQL